MNKQSKKNKQATNESQQQTDLKSKRQRKTSKKKEQSGSGLLHVSDERLLFHLECVRRNKALLESMDAGQLQPGLRHQHEQLVLQANQLETTISAEQSRRQEAGISAGGLA